MARPFDFDENIKQKAFFRQWNKCAHCGRSLIDVYDHAHHVVPNQLGRAGNPGDSWLRKEDNCIILCDNCHNRIHQNGNYRTGAVASPDYFPYSHGNEKGEHLAWVGRMQLRFWKK